MEPRTETRGSYQETLRVIGAWLDIRGLQNVRIVETHGELRVEASHVDGASVLVDELTFDCPRIERLRSAAKRDRGSALSRPVLDSQIPAHEPRTTTS